MDGYRVSLPDVLSQEALGRIQLMLAYDEIASDEEMLSLVRRAYKRAASKGRFIVWEEDIEAIHFGDRDDECREGRD